MMRGFALVFAAVAAPVVAKSGAAGSPVTKVIQLVKELKDRVVKDGETTTKAFKKYACWCEKTTDRKAAMIKKEKEEVTRLGNKVLAEKGAIASYTAIIARLEKAMKENLKMVEEAKDLRAKENAEFKQNKAEMEQTLNALERAIGVLGGAGTGSPATSALVAVRQALSASSVAASQSSEDAALIQRFMAYVQEGSRYAPQSGTIQGILKQMYTTFSQNLQAESDADMKKYNEFEGLLKTKKEQYAQLKSNKEGTIERKSKAEGELAEATQLLEDTTDSLNDNAEFFHTTKENCEAKTSEWNTRKTARAKELEGIHEALKLLDSPEARQLFKDAIKPGQETISFLQKSSHRHQSSPKLSAMNSLKAAARKSHSLRLAALAVTLKKSGHFQKVLAAIEEMMKTLDAEEKLDATKRDGCKEKEHEHSEAEAKFAHEVERNTATLTKLTKEVSKKLSKIDDTVETLKLEKKTYDEMSEQRDTDHAAFLQAKSDDETAAALLEQTIEILGKYAEAHPAAAGEEEAAAAPKSFLQKAASSMRKMAEPEFAISEDQAPDLEFKKLDDNKQENAGIVSILTMLAEDLRNEVKQGEASEIAANKAFHDAEAVYLKSKDTLEETKLHLDADVVTLRAEFESMEDEKTMNTDSLETETGILGGMAPGCKWLYDNFEARRDARKAEMTGLEQAKSILAGAQTTGLLQSSNSYANFDDADFGSIRFANMQ